MRKMKLVVSEGRLLDEHFTTLNDEQIKIFHDVLHWYEKATDKIVKRFAKGIPQEKEIRYSKVVAGAIGETKEIEECYQKVLNGGCTVGDFKGKVEAWFYKVRNGMNDVDRAARKAKEPWCDYEDDR